MLTETMATYPRLQLGTSISAVVLTSLSEFGALVKGPELLSWKSPLDWAVMLGTMGISALTCIYGFNYLFPLKDPMLIFVAFPVQAIITVLISLPLVYLRNKTRKEPKE